MSLQTALRTAFWVLMALVLLMRGYFSARVRRSGERLLPDGAAIQREGRAAFALRFVAFFALLGWLLAYAINPPWVRALNLALPIALRWGGFVLGLASLAFWTWTQVALDTQWSAPLQLRDGHHLVTTGPYARMRHPLYTAMFGWAISLALVTANWVFAAMAALTVIGLASRAPREEAMMVAQFGDEYRKYMARTGRFWPK